MMLARVFPRYSMQPIQMGERWTGVGEKLEVFPDEAGSTLSLDLWIECILIRLIDVPI